MELLVLWVHLCFRLKRLRLKFLFLAFYRISSEIFREIERESYVLFFLLYFKYGYLKVVFQVLALFLLSNENSNSFALTTNAYKGSKFKFQQIEPKSTWLQPERGNLSMYNRRVMPLCSKTLRKKTDP